jgi:putative ABC transport system permease protein
MHTLLQDLRYAMRMLSKNPGFTFTAILTLALGIGANTAIFSVVNAIILKPLPYKEPQQLVKVYQAQPDPKKGMLPAIWAYPRFELLREQGRNFSAVAGYKQNPYNLTGTDNPESLPVEMVSHSYFALLDIQPILGSAFAPDEEEKPGTNFNAIISYNLWQRRFDGDPQVIGETLELDKHPFTIIGVLPPNFRGQEGTAEAWVSMMAAPTLRYKGILTNPKNYWFQVIARLQPNVTPAQVQAEMQLVSEKIEQTYRQPSQRPSAMNVVTLVALRDANVDPAIRRAFVILLVAVGLVLLIACANVANLFLARAVSRQKEFALRLALGAERGRIIRQLLTESVLLSLTGGLIGLLVALWGVDLLSNFKPSDDAQFWTMYTRTFDFFKIRVDLSVLAFNFLLTFTTGILFGLFPALQASRANLTEALKEGAGSSMMGFRPLNRPSTRSLLVVAQLALSLVLLVGAGLMVKSLLRLQSINVGFAPDQVLTMLLPSRDAKLEFYEQLLGRLESMPGVEAASIASTAPLLGYASKTVMDIQGRTEQVGVGLHCVSADYFKTLGIQIVKGRVFTEHDRKGAPRVAVINKAAAEHLFADEDPLGKRIKPHIDPQYPNAEEFIEIVGIVDDVKYGKVEEKVEPDVYLSYLQPTDVAATLVLRSRLEPAALISSIRRAARELDKNVPLTRITTMAERRAAVTSRTRFISVLLGLFAGLALLISAIGIYGVMAYSVSVRTREIGIRQALGARPIDVFGLVLKEGFVLIVAGLLVGLGAALATTRVLSSQLFEVSATDPLTFMFLALLLTGVALLACYIPARRATKVDPMVALRHE